MFSVRRPREVSHDIPARPTRCAHRNTKRIITDSRSSRSQCISHSDADVCYEEIKLTNRIHTSASHRHTCAIITNVTCAWTASTTSLCALIFRNEPCGDAILDRTTRIYLEHVQQYRRKKELRACQLNTSTTTSTQPAERTTEEQRVQRAAISHCRPIEQPKFLHACAGTCWCPKRS